MIVTLSLSLSRITSLLITVDVWLNNDKGQLRFSSIRNDMIMLCGCKRSVHLSCNKSCNIKCSLSISYKWIKFKYNSTKTNLLLIEVAIADQIELIQTSKRSLDARDYPEQAMISDIVSPQTITIHLLITHTKRSNSPFYRDMGRAFHEYILRIFRNGWMDRRDAFHAVLCLHCCVMDKT